MRASANPLVWGVWGMAVTLVTVTTRDPLYLALALIATTIVYLTRATSASDAATWSLVVRIGALVSIVSVIFNLLTVHAGDTVIWVNHDMVAHCVTEEITKAWTSDKIPNDSSWKMIVKKSADYFCAIHQVMKGKIIVE